MRPRYDQDHDHTGLIITGPQITALPVIYGHGHGHR